MSKQARSDADSMIISSALNVSDKPTVVVGTDTDLLVVLIARAPKDSQMYMLRPSSNNTIVFDINSLQSAVGECKDSRLFLHAVTGCDTTSALYNQGKKKAYKLLKEHTGLAKDVSIFNMPQAAKKDLSRLVKSSCYIGMVLRILPRWMHSGTMHIHVQ